MERAGKACQKNLLAMIVMAAVMMTAVTVTQAATANEKTAYSFFTDTMELSPAAACGIMSNIASESGFQADINGMGGAYGICQWTGPRLSG